MINKEIFSKCCEPWIVRWAGRIENLTSNLQLNKQILIIHLNANKMTNLNGFYSVISKSLKLPEYFSNNLNSLSECITDLDWLPSEGYLLIIENSDQFLKDESLDTMNGVFETFENAALEWSQPICENEEWDRPALPFHVVLHVNPENEVMFSHSHAPAWECIPCLPNP